jgi:RNA polymerase sigma factor (sigma-70 family)
VRQVSVSTEDDLVVAARSGGTWAFAELWRLMAPTVAGYVRSRGVADPDDVTSEVFLAAFARIGDFEGSAVQFRRFLFTLAHHKSVDDIRRRFGPRVPRFDELDVDSDPRRSSSAEEVALSGHLDPHLADALAALPESQREVLLLRVVAGLDVSEVAAVIGRSEGAVKQLQHRALTTLRSELPDRTSAVGVTNRALPPIAGLT